MPKFRKKPVVIEAWPFDGSWISAQPAINAAHKSVAHWGADGGGGYVRIKTLEGEMRAQSGDWIIMGVHGELYPCKADIFAETYEPAINGRE